jgi:hypothetical protein
MSTTKSETPSGLLTTGIPWLDRAVEQSGLPPVLDTGGACMLYAQLSGSSLSDEYFQRLPIPFRRIGRTRVYEYSDVVAYVKEQRALTPRKTPEPWKRRRRKLKQT